MEINETFFNRERSVMPVRFLLFLSLLLLPAPVLSQVRPLDLVPTGEPRALPERILGTSAEPFWDDFIKDPAKVAAIKSLHLAHVRFPGGSQSNYYDWMRGLFFVTPGENHSPYYERFVTLSRFVTRKYPEGIFLEQYKAFSESIDAEVVMVPNLETASVEDQAEWFKRLSCGTFSRLPKACSLPGNLATIGTCGACPLTENTSSVSAPWRSTNQTGTRKGRL
jgi:hypothetical protein